MVAIRLPLLVLLQAVEVLCGRSLVLVNSGLRVSRGRFVSLRQSELQISAGAGADCKVQVVMNEPVTQRVGRMVPQVFDCSFLEDEVKYVHNGNPLLDKDVVLLRVYRFTSSDTLVETVVLSIQVEDSGSGLVELGTTPLAVPDFLGLSNAIDASVLDIRTPADVVCTVRLMGGDADAPTAGQLVRGDSGQRKGRQVEALCPGNKPCLHSTITVVDSLKTSCQDFLSTGLMYQHLYPPSPQTDYVPIRVEFRQQATRALLESEAVWLPVLIHGAVQNQPPQPAFMASFILEVDQFVLTPLTTATLDATDAETPRERLVFNMTVPPVEGYITHLDDHTRPVRSFTWTDLNDMKVAYQPPNSSHAERRNYEVEFQSIDGSYAVSPPMVVHISIRASETKAPRVSWNMGLDLLEGQSRPITWEELQIVDNDDDVDAVRLVAVDGPVHGQLSVREMLSFGSVPSLCPGRKAFMFYVRDLKRRAVVYHHSDSDSTRDDIVFRISDGHHSIRHKFPINVVAKDDSPPFLVNNVVVEVREGGAVCLQDFLLLASDLDSSDDHILYQVVSAPRAGQLVRGSPPHHTVVPVEKFLQRDLVQGQIFYQHSGDEHFEDSFDFTLSDSHQPPNLSGTYTVVVQVFPVKDQLPLEVSGSVRSLTVKETEVVHVTQAQLHFTDPENPDTDLTFVVTRSCFSPLHPGLMDAGRLFYADGANAMKKDHMAPVLKSFTQHAVTHRKVAFMPPVEDIGPEQLFVQFVFSVRDQHGGTISGLVFNITITPVDNMAPEVFTNLLRVEEGGSTFVTQQNLLVQDRDSPEEVLRLEVRRMPLHGRLELQGAALLPGVQFSLLDVRGLKLRYIHDDSETLEDQVSLTVTDGVNSADVVLPVQILPMNDEPPQLSGGLRGALSCQEGGQVQVTVDYLSATDRDSDNFRLTYMLARRPGRGELRRSGLSVDRFSQHDLLQGRVSYVHSGAEVGPQPASDTITLIISDGEAGGMEACCHGDASPPPVPLHGTLPVYDLNVTILPVNNKVPTVILGESVLMVDEGSTVCLCGGVLGASDPDSPPEELTFYLETSPLHGFLENMLPSAGSEKSNAGLRVESFSLADLTSGFINYVQSEHKGVEPTVDQLSVSVSDGLHRSASIPVYIIINPTNDEMPSLLLSNFTVEEGGLVALTPSILDASDLDAPPPLLTFTLESPPAHGGLINGADTNRYALGGAEVQRSLQIQSFTLQDLQTGLKIVYIHDGSETLEDAVVLRLTDGVQAVEGTAWVTVLPVNDNPPRLLTNAGLHLNCGERRVISSMVLEVQDLDSTLDQVFYFLNAMPQFGNLQLKVQSRLTDLSAGQNFTQDDVDMNRLWYHHTGPTDATGFRGHDSFRFSLTDGSHQSPAHKFYITIRTVNKGNIVLMTRPVQVREGQRVVLTTDVLLASDLAGRPEDLVFAVTVPPRRGVVHNARRPGVSLAGFTQMDVAANHICYSHDNSHDGQVDQFSFRVSNGDSSRSGSLHFHIEVLDRVPPTLNRNSGLRLQGGSTAAIGAEQLQLTDPDTAAADLMYAVTRLPRHGTLLLGGAPLPAPPRFSQTHVDQRILAYRFSPGSPVQNDRFHFLPSDGSNRGYLQFGQLREEPATFSIQVDRVDQTPPVLTTRRTPSVLVVLGAGRYGIFITRTHLQASDHDSPADQVQFSISRPPQFGNLENAATGAAIRNRFLQLDVDQRAVVFVVPEDMEVTADSFQFHLVDPAGNAGPPQTLDLSWSQVELLASCYRTCESAGLVQIQIRRSGRSLDPAYVAIQVLEGSAKVGRDFSHSSAGLIQFDPGVNLKTWNIYLVDDGLEENHENFSVLLTEPQNAVLGRRTWASVEILDPRPGNCVPENLNTDQQRPPSPTQPDPDVDPVTDVEAELLWEIPPHRPRGDVPNRLLDPGEAEPQDQSAPGFSHAHRQGGGLVGVATGGGELVGVATGGGELVGVATGGGELVGGATGGTQLRDEGRKNWTCPDGWTTYRRRCYIISSSVATWTSADRTCSLLYNSSLSVLRSRREVSWLWKLNGRKPFWIGASAGPDHWTWTGRSSVDLKGVLTDGCLLVTNPRNWTLTDCRSDAQHTFICSSDPV